MRRTNRTPDAVISDWHYEQAHRTAAYFALSGFRVVSSPWRRPAVALRQFDQMRDVRAHASPAWRSGCWECCKPPGWNSVRLGAHRPGRRSPKRCSCSASCSGRGSRRSEPRPVFRLGGHGSGARKAAGAYRMSCSSQPATPQAGPASSPPCARPRARATRARRTVRRARSAARCARTSPAGRNALSCPRQTPATAGANR